MNFIEAHSAWLKLGAGYTLFCAVVHFLTTLGQESGFRLAPRGRREWLSYWFRTLEQAMVGAFLLSGDDGLGLWPLSIFGGILFALIFSSVVFWRWERGLSLGGLVFILLFFLVGACFPVVG